MFDVKLDLTRKVRLVAGDHRNKDVPSFATFSTVASRDSIRLIFLIAAMNKLDLLSAEIGNTYLNAKCREMVHVRTRTIWSETCGKVSSTLKVTRIYIDA